MSEDGVLPGQRNEDTMVYRIFPLIENSDTAEQTLKVGPPPPPLQTCIKWILFTA